MLLRIDSVRFHMLIEILNLNGHTTLDTMTHPFNKSLGKYIELNKEIDLQFLFLESIELHF